MYREFRIVYDEFIRDKVVDFLKENGICSYFVIPKLEAEWNEKIKHLNCHIWPGNDEIIIIILENGKSEELIEKLKVFKEGLVKGIGFKVIIAPVQEII